MLHEDCEACSARTSRKCDAEGVIPLLRITPINYVSDGD